MGRHRADKGESTSEKNARTTKVPTAEERTGKLSVRARVSEDAKNGLEATLKQLDKRRRGE